MAAATGQGQGCDAETSRRVRIDALIECSLQRDDISIMRRPMERSVAVNAD
jgi:hypothetical protein